MTGTPKPVAGKATLARVYIPFAADCSADGNEGGIPIVRRIAIRPLSAQFPSSAQLPELGQASLAVPLVRVSLARRASSQAHPLEGDECLTIDSRLSFSNSKVVTCPFWTEPLYQMYETFQETLNRQT